jgi:hypothetical protein
MMSENGRILNRGHCTYWPNKSSFKRSVISVENSTEGHLISINKLIRGLASRHSENE